MASTMRFDNWQTTDGTSIATTNASGDITFAGAVAGAGKIVQVVNATYSTQTDTSSSTFVTTNLTANITPSSASSKVLVTAYVPFSVYDSSTRSGYARFEINRDGTQVAETGNLGYNAGTSTGRRFSSAVTMVAVDTPASTSSLTYTINMRYEVSAAAVQAFYGNYPGYIVLMEVAS